MSDFCIYHFLHRKMKLKKRRFRDSKQAANTRNDNSKNELNFNKIASIKN